MSSTRLESQFYVGMSQFMHVMYLLTYYMLHMYSRQYMLALYIVHTYWDRGGSPGVLDSSVNCRPTDRGSNPNAGRFVYLFPRLASKRNNNKIGNKRHTSGPHNHI